MSVPPIRLEVTVAADPERAFTAFTDDISAWWPMEGHSVLGHEALVGFDDGVLTERTVDGREAIWGTVLVWEPGELLRITWHPGREADPHTEVTASFQATDGGTLVTLVHSGWEALADAQARRDEDESGWPQVLASFGEYLETESVADDTWAALMHTPGPDAPRDEPVVNDPRFGEHLAFLQRLSAAGYLVAAGPFTDADGSGMTIVHLPGEDRLAEVVHLATEDDAAVRTGLLAVTVRPWNVIFDATN